MKSLVLLICITIISQACGRSSTDQTTGTTTIPADTSLDTTAREQMKKSSVKLEPEETAFIEKAAVGGMMEVETGHLTTQKTHNKKVIDFAKMMIKDHTRTNQELQMIAKGMGIELPGALPAAEQGHLAGLRQMQANEYDQNYMDMMVADHAKTIDLFNGASRFSNARLKAFAIKTLPTLQSHNKMAIAIDTLFKTKKPDNSGDDLLNIDKKRKN